MQYFCSSDLAAVLIGVITSTAKTTSRREFHHILKFQKKTSPIIAILPLRMVSIYPAFYDGTVSPTLERKVKGPTLCYPRYFFVHKQLAWIAWNKIATSLCDFRGREDAQVIYKNNSDKISASSSTFASGRVLDMRPRFRLVSLKPIASHRQPLSRCYLVESDGTVKGKRGI